MIRSNKYTGSVEDHLDALRKNSAKKKKPNKPRLDTIEGFVKLDNDEEVNLFLSDLKTEFDFPDRTPSLINLILYHFDDEFLDLLIEKNVDLSEPNQLPPLFSNPSAKSRRRDLDSERRKLVLSYIATRFYIMSNPANELSKNFPLNSDAPEICLSRNNFKLMLVHMLIRMSMVEAVNARLSKYTLSGRHVMLDEKHKGTNREQHLARWVHGKDPNWGHWITEVTTIAPKTGMPILLKCMPLTSTDPEKVTSEPYNNLSLVDVHREVVACLREGSIIVEDAYYLDDQSRTYLRKEGFNYISAINPVRFKEVWEGCEKYVQNKGDWVVMKNIATNEHAMMRWDPMGERKQYVLTDSFETRKKLSKKSTDINAISATYKLLFNGCDRYNSFLHNKYWPYARIGWQANFDDFFFSSFAMNIYVMYHEVIEISSDKNMKWSDFSLLVAQEINNHVLLSYRK